MTTKAKPEVAPEPAEEPVEALPDWNVGEPHPGHGEAQESTQSDWGAPGKVR